MPIHAEAQPTEVDILIAVQALPDACPVWQPYACVTLDSRYSGPMRLDFALKATQLHGRLRWFWRLVKVIKLGSKRESRAASKSRAARAPVVHFRQEQL